MVAEMIRGDPMIETRYLTVQEAAEVIGIAPFTMRKWLRLGKLPGINYGGSTGWRISEADLVDFLDDQARRSQIRRLSADAVEDAGI